MWWTVCISLEGAACCLMYCRWYKSFSPLCCLCASELDVDVCSSGHTMEAMAAGMVDMGAGMDTDTVPITAHTTATAGESDRTLRLRRTQ